MKAIFRLVLLHLMTAFIISCTQEDIINEVKNVPVSISASSCNSTKASSPGSEEAVRSIQVLMFRDGILQGSGHADASDVKMMVGEGIYDIYVFVNDPTEWASDPDVTEEEIMSSQSLLEDNSMSSFVMFGYRHGVRVDNGTGLITVPVDRLVSKIVFEEVRTDFGDNPYFKGETLEIKRIYLSNILGSCSYSLTPDGSPPDDGIWFCRMGAEDIPDALKSMTADDVIGMTIPDGGSQNLSKVYYAYPNGCISDTSSDNWSPRRTRLVIEAVLNGEQCWYHITLPPMKPNVTYCINSCTIKNMGGTSPEEHLGPACEASLTTSLSWEETYFVEEES